MPPALLLLLVACSSEPPPDPAARRQALVQRIQAELGPAYTAPVPGLAEADPNLGIEVYGKSCAPCHGLKADGRGMRASALNPPPTDLVHPPAAGALSEAGEMWVIRNGSPGTGMPAWKVSLSEAQMLAVYRYIQSLRQPVSPSP